MDVLKEGVFKKITPKPVFVLSPGYAQLPDGLKYEYAMIALLSEGKKDVIIPAPNREMEARNAMGGLRDHSLYVLVLDEVLGLELSNFSRQLKMKLGIDDDDQVIVEISHRDRMQKK